MLTITQHITACASLAQSSAIGHVGAHVLYGLRSGIGKPAQRSMWEAAVAGGLNSKTVYRHIGFAVAVVSQIKKKYPDHARMVELKEANSTEAQVSAVMGFLGDMGVDGAAEAELWAKGDGLPLTREKTAELRAEKAEKAKPEKAGDAPLVPLEIKAPEVVEPVVAPTFAETLVSVSDDELLAMYTAIVAERKARKMAAPAEPMAAAA